MFIPTIFKRNFVDDVFDDVFPTEFNKKSNNSLMWYRYKGNERCFFT